MSVEVKRANNEPFCQKIYELLHEFAKDLEFAFKGVSVAMQARYPRNDLQ